MKLHVECYSGYRGEETPRNFRFNSKKIKVRDLLDQWLSPDHRYFKVLGDDDSVYIIRHDVVSENWELAFFQQKDETPGTEIHDK